jgi:hypothetical protein
MSKRKTTSQAQQDATPSTETVNGQAGAVPPAMPEVPVTGAGADAADLGTGATEPPPKPLIPGIDLDGVALDGGYQEDMAGEDAPVTIAVSKASGQGFFRAHPTLWRNVRMLEVKNGPDRGFYLVANDAKRLLQSDENEDVKLFPARLTLCYARDTGLFLWPLRLPEPGRENRIDDWAQSALRVCKLAENQWVKLFAKKGGNCYSHRVAEGIKTEPPWPPLDLNQVAGMAFEGKYLIDSQDPLIRRLLGKE